MKKLYDFIYNSQRRFPDKNAIIYKDKKYTFSELNNLVLSVSKGLADKAGVNPNDRVIIMLPNIPEFAIFYYAVNLVGGVVVPINPTLKESEISYIISNSEPKLAVILKEDFPVFYNLQKSTNFGIVIVNNEEDKPDRKIWSYKSLISTNADIKEKYNDLAVIIYTSGTTGFPKGAMLSNYNIISNVVAVQQVLDLLIDDVFVGALPLFHAFGQTSCMNLPFYLGCSVVFIDRFIPQHFTESIIKNGVSLLPAVPVFYASLLQSPLAGKIGNLRYSVSGGAPLPENIELEFEKRFDCKILQGYGLSECSPIVSVNPPNFDKTGSVGNPLPNVEVKLVDEEDRILDKGIGEIIVKGPNVMMGYWKMESPIVDGYFYTGDIGKIDEDGFLYIVDRKKELIIVGGLKVYPSEVERMILSFGGILECAVIGKKDKDRGEVPIAFVVPQNEIDTKELLSYLRKNLAPYKVPKEIIIKERLPKSNTGKVMKRELVKEI